MGNCTSCLSSSNIHAIEYGCLDNSLHIKTAVDGGDGVHKLGSSHSREGSKGLNQDSTLLFQGYGETRDGAFCAIFDGHGMNGHIVSRVVRNQLSSLLLQQRKIMDWEQAYVSAFKAMDKEVKLIDMDLSFSGCTATVVVKHGEDLAIANLGDSRAVLGRLTENGIQATQLTVDLKPGVPAETERIRNSNGRVFAHETEPHIQRVWLPNEDIPGLAMSRAFGDFDMKNHGITVTPEVSHYRLTSQDIFVVVASDGIWDVLSNEEVISIVWSTTNKEAAAKAVVDEAVAAWRRKFPKAKVDDCSVVCLFIHEREDSVLPVVT